MRSSTGHLKLSRKKAPYRKSENRYLQKHETQTQTTKNRDTNVPYIIHPSTLPGRLITPGVETENTQQKNFSSFPTLYRDLACQSLKEKKGNGSV